MIVAFSVALFLSIQVVRTSVESSFQSALSQTDLIVGARGGSTQLLLYSVFHMGQGTHTIRHSTYERYQKHPAVAWTIPLALGDSHRGFRVVATTPKFFEHYRFAQDQRLSWSDGKPFEKSLQVVLGSEVAKQLGYTLDSPLVISHGLQPLDESQDHSDHPFRVSGVLRASGTPVDRLVFISLQDFELIHSGLKDTLPSTLTAFYVGLKSRLDVFRFQREVNEDAQEPLMAILPGATLSEFWRNLSVIEAALTSIAWAVLIVSLLSILVALVSVVSQRNREFAILRAVGMSRTSIASLSILESLMMTLLGIVAGVLLMLTLFSALSPWGAELLGLHLTLPRHWDQEIKAMIVFLGSAFVVGLIPAISAYKGLLTQGLSPRV
jgi:putative ABC transport system permease protein